MNGEKRIILTGATGFVGSTLLKRMLEENYSVLCVVLSTEVAEFLRLGIECEIVVAESDMQSLRYEFERFKPDSVIHLAALSTSSDKWEIITSLVEANVLFANKLTKALETCSTLKLFINIGSFSEYREKVTQTYSHYFYSATKTAFRHMLSYFQHAFNYEFSIINTFFSTVYGPGEKSKKLIHYILDSLGSSVPVDMSPGEQVLDFVHLNDVAEYFIRMLGKDLGNTKEYVIELGTGTGTTPREIAKMFEKISGKKANINWGGIPYRKNDTMKAIADISSLRGTLNWVPGRTMEQSLPEVYQEYVNRIC